MEVDGPSPQAIHHGHSQMQRLCKDDTGIELVFQRTFLHRLLGGAELNQKTTTGTMLYGVQFLDIYVAILILANTNLIHPHQ